MIRRSLLSLLACLIFLPGQPIRIHSAPAQDKDRSAKPRTDRRGDPLPPGAVARFGSVRLQHGEEVGGLVFSPDGKTLASGGDDGSVRLWGTATGREVRRFTGHTGTIHGVAFAPDGKAIASADDAGVRVWDIAAGKSRLRWSSAGGPSAAVAFAPDGKMLAAGCEGKLVALYDLATGKRRRELPCAGGPQLLAFSGDGKLLAAAGAGATLELWDVRTGKKVQSYRRGEQEVSGDKAVYALAFAPDGKTLAAAGEDGVRLWALGGAKEVRRLTLGDAAVCSLRFAPDGKTVTGVGDDGRGADWETATGKVLRQFGKAQEELELKAVSPDGRTAAADGALGRIELLDVATGKLRRVADACPSPILAVGFAPDGRFALATCFDATTFVWEPTTGRERRRFGPRGALAGTAAFSPDSKRLALGDEAGTVRLWDVPAGRELRTWEGHNASVSQFAFSPDGRALVSAAIAGPARVWSVDSGKARFALGAARNDSGPVVFAPDGRTIAVCYGARQAEIWEMATGKKRLRFWLGKNANCLAVSPDGRLLAAGEEGGIALYRAATGKLVRRMAEDLPERAAKTSRGPRAVLRPDKPRPVELKGERSILTLAFSPDGKYLAGAGEDRTVCLYHVGTGKALGRLAGHEGAVRTLAFSPDGKRLVSGSQDRTALVWDVEALLRPAAVGKPAPLRLDELWAALGGADAQRAGAALNELVAHPRRAVPFLAGRLRPAPPADAKRLARLVADLESDQFPVREKANKELEAAAEFAEPLLRKVLEGKPSLETRRRVERLLEKLDLPITSPELLRSLRAVEALERIGTPEAEELLRKLAGGAAEARLTREAKAALDRPPFRRRN